MAYAIVVTLADGQTFVSTEDIIEQVKHWTYLNANAKISAQVVNVIETGCSPEAIEALRLSTGVTVVEDFHA